MKCPNCGAEAQGKFCEYCGSEIPQGNANVGGCPKCGCTNLTFKRERVGTATQSRSQKNMLGKGRTSHAVSQSAYRTVGICQSCGYTWNPNSSSKSGKKTWLWVLGWICMFPVPLTIILLKKKDLKPAVKYSIIAVAWLLFFIIGLSGGETENIPSAPPTPTTGFVEQTEEAPTEVVPETTENDSPWAKQETTIRRFVDEFNALSDTPVTEIDFQKNHTIAYLIVDGCGKMSIKVNDHDDMGFFFTFEFSEGTALLEKYEALMTDIVKVFDTSIDVGAKFQEARENEEVVIQLSDTVSVKYHYIKDAIGYQSADTYIITLTSTDYNKP